jgi:hypothetical protein
VQQRGLNAGKGTLAGVPVSDPWDPGEPGVGARIIGDEQQVISFGS